MRTTLKDIAQKANVNFTLVSKYINKTPGVSMRPETRERIQKAIEELNYHPIAAARALRSGKSNTLGLVVGNLTNEYFAHFADAAIAGAEKLGYRLLISVCRGSSPEQAINHLEANQVDGIVCSDNFQPGNAISPILTERSFTPESMEEALQKMNRYFLKKNCKTMALLYSSPSWKKTLDHCAFPGLKVSKYILDNSAEKRLDMLRRICRKRPDALFSTGWITVNQLSALLDAEFPGYDPLIICRANCKGPFLRNPRIRGVILTSTRHSIEETFSFLAKMIRSGNKMKRPEPAAGRFILRSSREYKGLAVDSFALT